MSYSGHDNQSLIVGTVLNTSQTATEFNGTFGTLTSAPTAIFPNSYNAINPHTKYPTIMSYSLGVQRYIGLGTRVDVAYVGTLARHLDDPQSAFDAVPPGSQFLPQNQDPTNPGLPLPDDFFRPYRGILEYHRAAIREFELQRAASRGCAPVFQEPRVQRELCLVESHWATTPLSLPITTTNCNMASCRSTGHMFLRFYYVYNLPKVPAEIGICVPARWTLDDWQLSGISTFQSGFPQSLNCQFTYPVNLFGGGDYSRCILTGPRALVQRRQDLLSLFQHQCDPTAHEDKSGQCRARCCPWPWS